jgi:hypothetical protein
MRIQQKEGKERVMQIRRLAAVFVTALLAFAVAGPPVVSAAEEKLPSKSDASCVKCHADYEKTANLLAGKLVEVANKSGTIQLQIDKDMEVIYFDDSTQLKNAPAFKDIPKQESIRVSYIKKDGQEGHCRAQGEACRH